MLIVYHDGLKGNERARNCIARLCFCLRMWTMGGEMTMRRKLLTMLTVLALILVAAVAVATVVYVVGRML